MSNEYITRTFDYETTSNDEINAAITRLNGEGFKLVSFEDDRKAGKLHFVFKRSGDGQNVESK